MAVDAKDGETRKSNGHSKENGSVSNGQTKTGVTFASQDKLPRLPIPDLTSTCKKYLAALEPLQGHREHLETERAVAEFLKSDGPELQEKLTSYAGDKSSYIEQFCEYDMVCSDPS